MQSSKKMLTVIVAVLSAVGLASAQSTANQTVTMQVNAIGVLRVTGNPAALVVSAPASGGLVPDNPQNNSTYAQYTSTVPSGQTRRLTAHWGASDEAPAGCSLKLTATTPGGNQGSSAGQITLSATAQNVVTGIRSCATGQGPTSGAQLTYVLSVDDVELLVAGETKTATVTLTLTDAS